MFGRKRTAPRNLLRTAGYRGMGGRWGDRGRPEIGEERDGDMQSEGLDKIRYRAQTSCSPIEPFTGRQKRKALTGISDLKLFPVKSRNKSRLKNRKEDKGWVRRGRAHMLLIPCYQIPHAILLNILSVVLKTKTHLRSKVPDVEKL